LGSRPRGTRPRVVTPPPPPPPVKSLTNRIRRDPSGEGPGGGMFPMALPVPDRFVSRAGG
jgi:hypothetical protein